MINFTLDVAWHCPHCGRFNSYTHKSNNGVVSIVWCRHCEKDAELVSDKNTDLDKQNKKMESALKRIANWDELSLEFMVDNGSNGQRDYYRNVAKEALKNNQDGE